MANETKTDAGGQQTLLNMDPPKDAPKDAPPKQEAKPEEKKDAAPEPKKAEGDGGSTLLTGDADGKPQDKPEGDKTPAAPLSLKPPDGVKSDDPGFVKFVKYATEKKWSQEQAEGALALYVEAQNEGQSKLRSAFAEQKKAWAESTKSDPEVGGEKLASSLTSAKRAIDKYGSKGLREMLDQSGLGNHPEVIRFFAKVGRSLSEDSFSGSLGGRTPKETPSQESKLRQMYPSMFPKE